MRLEYLLAWYTTTANFPCWLRGWYAFLMAAHASPSPRLSSYHGSSPPIFFIFLHLFPSLACSSYSSISRRSNREISCTRSLCHSYSLKERIHTHFSIILVYFEFTNLLMWEILTTVSTHLLPSTSTLSFFFLKLSFYLTLKL